MDEVVFNKLKDAEKFEVVSVSNRGFTLGVKPSKGFHKARTQTVDASTAIKTGDQVDRTCLANFFPAPKQK